MVKKQEVDYLTNQKFNEGKEGKQVYKEINDLRQAEIIFRENKREIKALNRIIDKQENKIKKLTKLNFDLGLKVNSKIEQEETKVNPHNATVSDLKMIMRVMKLEDKPMTKTDLMRGCGYTQKRIVPCLMFLSSVNLITNGSDDGTKRYSLK